MAITLVLTENEAARILYAMANEANDHHAKMQHEIKAGPLNIASGRLQKIHKEARDECLSVMRKIDGKDW